MNRVYSSTEYVSRVGPGLSLVFVEDTEMRDNHNRCNSARNASIISHGVIGRCEISSAIDDLRRSLQASFAVWAFDDRRGANYINVTGIEIMVG